MENAMTMPAKDTVCLWYDGSAEDAARFYADTFPDSSVGAVHRAPGDFPSGKPGDVLTVEFTVMGFPASGSTADPRSHTTRRFHFRWQRLTKPKRIAIGTRSSATEVMRARAAGVRISGGFPGR
jgi:predicted 3-demethylubiquinone-9 3-methyltransferase (glyoxalase superfamily)